MEQQQQQQQPDSVDYTPVEAEVWGGKGEPPGSTRIDAGVIAGFESRSKYTQCFALLALLDEMGLPYPSKQAKRIYLPGGLPDGARTGVNASLEAGVPVVLTLTSCSAVGTLFPGLLGQGTTRRDWLRSAKQLLDDKERINDEAVFEAMCAGGVTRMNTYTQGQAPAAAWAAVKDKPARERPRQQDEAAASSNSGGGGKGKRRRASNEERGSDSDSDSYEARHSNNTRRSSRRLLRGAEESDEEQDDLGGLNEDSSKEDEAGGGGLPKPPAKAAAAAKATREQERERRDPEKAAAAAKATRERERDKAVAKAAAGGGTPKKPAKAAAAKAAGGGTPPPSTPGLRSTPVIIPADPPRITSEGVDWAGGDTLVEMRAKFDTGRCKLVKHTAEDLKFGTGTNLKGLIERIEKGQEVYGLALTARVEPGKVIAYLPGTIMKQEDFDKTYKHGQVYALGLKDAHNNNVVLVADKNFPGAHANDPRCATPADRQKYVNSKLEEWVYTEDNDDASIVLGAKLVLTKLGKSGDQVYVWYGEKYDWAATETRTPHEMKRKK